MLRSRVLLLFALFAAVVAVAGVALGRGSFSRNALSPDSGSTAATRSAQRPLSAATAAEFNNQSYARMHTEDSTLTPAQLNNEGYATMRAGDYMGALPLLERAVARLTGTGSFDEAYAEFNLANTRYHLGDCTGVLTLLHRSQQIQGELQPISTLRNAAQKTCS